MHKTKSYKKEESSIVLEVDLGRQKKPGSPLNELVFFDVNELKKY